jgi:predicted Ser/Thr protein kinase
MATTKTTKREYINRILTYVHDEDKPYLLNELALLDKKSTAEKKPTAVQVANEGIKADIAEGMVANTLYTVTDIQKGIPACAELSNQRVSALLRQMVEAGVIVRTEDKRKAYFSLA